MEDALGSRMKHQYEHRTRYLLPRRTYTIIRLDGRAFHTYTRGRIKPFDGRMHLNLVASAVKLCEEAQGSQMAFVQSDEISVLLTDFATPQTDAWFDGNIQKIASISASIVTAHFNDLESYFNSVALGLDRRIAHFDSRVFTIPDLVEVYNYFIWRQKDIERNSLSLMAQQHYSTKQLHGKKREELHELLHLAGENWNDASENFRRGTVVTKGVDGWHFHAAPIFTADDFLWGQIT